jgi:dipeptidyl-peptidase-3
LDELAIKQILIYVSAVIDNTGNYKSFGDTKFIPECNEENFRKFFLSTPYWATHKEDFESIYSRIGKLVFNA